MRQIVSLMKDNFRIGIIGGGAMGGALVKGMLKSHPEMSERIIISNPHLDKIVEFGKEGVRITQDNKDVAREADLLVIAVKPWKVSEVISDLKDCDLSLKEISLIVAGIPGNDILEILKDHHPASISIAMPNTAMAVGKSMSFVVELKDIAIKIINILDLVGKTKIIEERLLPAATSLASCGIAYAMRYVRAATEGGVELGFRATEAQDIIAQTLAGTVALLEIPGSHPEVEIDKVTTPGGLTIKGLNTMEKEGFTNAVIQGLKASR